MSNAYNLIPETDYVDTCNAIRSKTGKTALLKSAELAPAINSIATRKPEQEKTVTPTKASQAVTPDTGKALSKVTVNPIPAQYRDTSDATATAAEVFSGKTAYLSDGKHSGTFTIESELANQATQIAALQEAVKNKAGGGGGGGISLPQFQHIEVGVATASQYGSLPIKGLTTKSAVFVAFFRETLVTSPAGYDDSIYSGVFVSGYPNFIDGGAIGCCNIGQRIADGVTALEADPPYEPEDSLYIRDERYNSFLPGAKYQYIFAYND